MSMFTVDINSMSKRASTTSPDTHSHEEKPQRQSYRSEDLQFHDIYDQSAPQSQIAYYNSQSDTRLKTIDGKQTHPSKRPSSLTSSSTLPLGNRYNYMKTNSNNSHQHEASIRDQNGHSDSQSGDTSESHHVNSYSHSNYMKMSDRNSVRSFDSVGSDTVYNQSNRSSLSQRGSHNDADITASNRRDDQSETNRYNSSPAAENDMGEMLAIELQFGKGRKDIIHVKFDDKPEDLAKVKESHDSALTT